MQRSQRYGFMILAFLVAASLAWTVFTARKEKYRGVASEGFVILDVGEPREYDKSDSVATSSGKNKKQGKKKEKVKKERANSSGADAPSRSDWLDEP